MSALLDDFEAARPHLRSVAHRLLGSAADADDALQEAWLRVARADTDGIDNARGWLTTVVARVCLNMLRARRSRPETAAEEAATSEGDPADQVIAADAVGPALLVVLDSLSPPERLAFVLHDVFGVPFAEVAPIVDRTPEATRQLASRARRRVRGAAVPPSDVQRDRPVVEAFLAAARDGDFGALLTVLDPDVVLRAGHRTTRGSEVVARTARGYAPFARFGHVALVDGESVGLAVVRDGTVEVVLRTTVAAGRITAIDVIDDRDRLQSLVIDIID